MSALEKGKEIEREHRGTYLWLFRIYEDFEEFPSEEEFYESIAADHLEENENYYDMLEKMEKSFKE